MIAAVMGWVGTIGSIGAYVLLSQGRWHATSLRYSALNGLAGLLAGAASALYGAWPSVCSNLVWVVIAGTSAMTTMRDRRARMTAVDQGPAPGPEPEAPAPPHRLLVAA